jgi:hypothetical protein
MKETLDLVRTTRLNKNRLFVTSVPGSRASCPESPRNAAINDHPVSDGAVWMFLAMLVLLLIAAGYVFWAKLNSAWPFDF